METTGKRTTMEMLRHEQQQRRDIARDVLKDPSLSANDIAAIEACFAIADQITEMIDKVHVDHPIMRDVIEVLVPLCVGITEAEPQKAVRDFFKFKDERRKRRGEEAVKVIKASSKDLSTLKDVVPEEILRELESLMDNQGWLKVDPELIEKYEKQQAASGIKEGDTVEIISKAIGGEQGWANYWTPRMNTWVGKTVTVIKNCGKHGLKIAEDSFCFPYFVMQKVIQTEARLVGGSNGTIQ
jgi:hypothetical protein